jgi:hypothetical protein
MRNKMYLYIANTWIVSLLIHSVIIYLFVVLVYDRSVDFSGAMIFSFNVLVAALLFSLPPVFFAMFFLRMILVSSLKTSFAAFLVWCLAIWISILIFPSLLSLLFLGELHIEELGLLLPALIASTLTLIIRFIQFENLFLLFRRIKFIKAVKHPQI